MQLAGALGDTDGHVTVIHDGDAAGEVRATQARRSLRAAGFRDVSVITVAQAAEVTSTPIDEVPDVVVLVTNAAQSADIAARLVANGSTDTIVVGPEFYTPGAPAVGSRAHGRGADRAVRGGHRREPAARVRRRGVRPGHRAHAAVASGYWAADLFLRGLERTGRPLTRERLLDVLNGDRFTYSVPGTVGRSTWPEMHTQPVPCGSLVQSDGTQYLVIGAYTCAAGELRWLLAVLEAEADLHRHLVPPDRALVDRAADVGDLEPVEVPQRLRRAPDAVADRVVEAGVRRPDDLRDLVRVVHVNPAPISARATVGDAVGAHTTRWRGRRYRAPMTLTIEPFEIDVPDEALRDLRDRLARARFPQQLDGAGWDYGMELGYLRELVDYWRDDYDWRRAEQRLAAVAALRHRGRRRAGPLPPRAVPGARRAPADHHARLARLDRRVPRRHRPVVRPTGARRRPGRRVPRGLSLDPRLRLLRADPGPRVGPAPRRGCVRAGDGARSATTATAPRAVTGGR